MRRLLSLLAAAALLAATTAATVAHSATDKARPTTQAWITHELLPNGRLFKLDKPVRATVLKLPAGLTARQAAAARRTYRHHHHGNAHAAYHHTCSHSTAWWWAGSNVGGYHRYIGYGTYPWVHTHYYQYIEFAGGIIHQYRTGPC
jgi:hypothetical protein